MTAADGNGDIQTAAGKTVRFRIRGMDCAEETNALKGTVGRLTGLLDLDFNLLEGTMSVRYDAAVLDEAAIRDAVQKAGFEAEKPEDAAGTAQVGPTWWQRHGRAVTCWISGVLVGIGFLTHALIHGSLLHALVGGEGMAHHEFPLPVILLYSAAAVAGGWFIAPKAWLALRRLRPDMNLLMTVAVIGAMVIGQWFEAGSVTFLFALSLLLESWSVERARRAVRALVSLTPPTARYVCPTDGDIMERPVADVPLGAIVLVRPGERIPLDGVVSKGRTSVNQAPITGESMPVAKQAGDEVFAGTINEDGAIEFKATKAAADTTLARIIRMVEEAQSRRAPAEQWVEKFARYYTPAMMILALLVAVVPPLFGGGWSRWFYEALVLLVIACPCALVISTPVSIVAGLTAASRAGVLIKGGSFLEAAARIKVFAMDKTGTLTKGFPEVQEVVPLNGHDRSELLARAAALEEHSEHPLAAAVLRAAQAEQVAQLRAEDFRALKGRGAEALIDGRPYWVGSHRLLHEKGAEEPEMHARIERMEDAGHSVVVVGSDRHVCGLISVADTVRPAAAPMVRELKSAGVRRVVVLTGDNEGTAQAVGKEVGADEIRAELLPDEKLEAIRELMQTQGATAMVGDGVNDAPALATATIGIAMGAAGTDAAIETADIALMSDDLSRLPWLVRHSQRTMRIIRQNIVFALGVKASFMTLAFLHVATLWMAIAADMGVSLLVVFNALRLLGGADRRRPGEATRKARLVAVGIIAAVIVVLSFIAMTTPRTHRRRVTEATVLAAGFLPQDTLDTTACSVREGEVMPALLARAGLRPEQIGTIVPALQDAQFNVGTMQPDDSLFVLTRDAIPVRLLYRRTFEAVWRVDLDSGNCRVSMVYRNITNESGVIRGVIKASLHEAIIEQGGRPELVAGYTDIFGWEIDFFVDVQPNDSFAIMVERRYCGSVFIGYGRILAAAYYGQIGNVSGFRFTDSDGNTDYYDYEGHSLRKTFQESPLRYSRVSSFFGRRPHPIRRVIRQHSGLDYVAPSGTPVEAVADGRVTSAGRSGGYGKLVEVGHAGGYSTRYGHLSGFGDGIKRGAAVVQGQVIGYVGSTGLSTGPHLHYEVRKSGSAVDPFKLNTPQGLPVKMSDMAEFLQTRDSLLRVLANGQEFATRERLPCHQRES
ncbi:MAG: heavy metal translocating P-type ATPase [candidate division WOR-3 bacterium]|nr:heavy metal translocating P-type ATPase [candidate division WOR-3 bacterium]